MADIKDYLRDIAARDGQQMLPAVSGSDNGKLLAVKDGVWDKVADRLPAVSGTDNGKCAKVAGGVWTAAAFPTELPAVTSDDNGKILKVVEGVWAAASAT